MKNIYYRYGALLLLLLCTTVLRAQNYFSIDGIHRVAYTQPVVAPFTPVVQVDVSYYLHPDSPDVYVNLFLKPGFSEPEHWIYQNLEMEAFPDTVQLTVQVDLSAYFPQEPGPPAIYLCGFAYTSQPWNVLPPGTIINYQPYTVGERTISIGNQLPDIAATGGLTLPSTPNTAAPPTVWQGDSVRGVLVGCNMPNIDLNDSIHNSFDEPDYAGDKNACAPAATTNSFTWLRGQHPGIDTVLAKKFGRGDTAMRHMLKTFSKMMGRDTSDYNRVTIYDFIRGKLAFIDSFRLPVHVKYQSISDNLINRPSVPSPNAGTGHSATNQNAPHDPAKPLKRITADWLYNEMKKGEDVELFIIHIKKDPAGNLQYDNAHYVTLTGIRETGGVPRIRFKDDNDQDRAGGLRHYIGTLKEDSILPGALYIPELSNDTIGRCYIKDAVSESFDSTVTYTTAINESPVGDKFFNLYPNPSAGVVYLVGGTNGPVSLSLLDMQGREVGNWQRQVHAGQPVVIHLPYSLSAGIYYASVKQSGRLQTLKLVLVHR